MTRQEFDTFFSENYEKLLGYSQYITREDPDLASDLVHMWYEKAIRTEVYENLRDGPLSLSKRAMENLYIDYKRGRPSAGGGEEAVSMDGKILEAMVEDDRTPEYWSQINDLKADLFDAMVGLSDQQRDIFILIEVEGLSPTETAEQLGTDYGSVRTQLSVAKSKMRKVLEGRGYDRSSRRPSLSIPSAERKKFHEYDANSPYGRLRFGEGGREFDEDYGHFSYNDPSFKYLDGGSNGRFDPYSSAGASDFENLFDDRRALEDQLYHVPEKGQEDDK